MEIKYRKGTFTYKADGRDLCYAAAKAATDALKKYGFRGDQSSSGSECCLGDAFGINQLLFIKAYALNALSVRKLTEVRRKPNGLASAVASSFADETALLLFDM